MALHKSAQLDSYTKDAYDADSGPVDPHIIHIIV